MEQDMRTRTNPKKNLGNMRHRMKDQTRENITVPLQGDVPKREMARDLSRHQQARAEKTTTCARIHVRTRNGPSFHSDPPAGVHSNY